MKEYFGGYYCRDPLFLQVINKTSNRKILQALRDAYPLGLDVDELGKKAKLPSQTIYAQKTELYREYYIDHYIESEPTKRGRPKSRLRDQTAKKRERIKYVIEETSGVYDPYKGKKLIPLPPGNFTYSEGFVDVWDKLIDKKEEEGPTGPCGPIGPVAPARPGGPCGPGGPGGPCLPTLRFIVIGSAASVYGIMFTPTSSAAIPIAATTAIVVLVIEKIENLDYICNPSKESLKGVSKKLEDYWSVLDY